MHTKDRLAAALREAGLETMAQKAEQGIYDDFLSPIELPMVLLVNDLALEMTKCEQSQIEVIDALRQRVIAGEFEATAEESEAWAESPDGQEAFRKLMGRTPT